MATKSKMKAFKSVDESKAYLLKANENNEDISQNEFMDAINDLKLTDEEMDDLFGSMPESEKPTVLHIYDENLKVVTNSFNTNMIVRAGGVNVASPEGKDQTNSANDAVNFEQILQWDPDYIVLGNFSQITPDQIYNNELAGQDWSQLKAVKNKHVYFDVNADVRFIEENQKKYESFVIFGTTDDEII